MRRFSSYGPVDIEENYYAPRKELIEKTYIQLVGENPGKTGHYITVWAPRQTGKSWIMQQILLRLNNDPRFYAVAISVEDLKDENNTGIIIASIAEEIGIKLNKDFSGINTQAKFKNIFRKGTIERLCHNSIYSPPK